MCTSRSTSVPWRRTARTHPQKTGTDGKNTRPSPFLRELAADVDLQGQECTSIFGGSLERTWTGRLEELASSWKG